MVVEDSADVAKTSHPDITILTLALSHKGRGNKFYSVQDRAPPRDGNLFGTSVVHEAWGEQSDMTFYRYTGQ